MPIVKLRKPVESKRTHVHLIFKPEDQERMQDLKNKQAPIVPKSFVWL